MRTGAINHLALTVRDLKESKKFYTELLGRLGYSFKGELGNLEDRPDGYFGCAFWGNGDTGTWINLWEKSPDSNGKHYRYDVGLNHVAFHVATQKELEEIYKWVSSSDCEILDPPENRPDYGEYYRSFYLKELNGIKIEIVTQEPIDDYPRT